MENELLDTRHLAPVRAHPELVVDVVLRRGQGGQRAVVVTVSNLGSAPGHVQTDVYFNRSVAHADRHLGDWRIGPHVIPPGASREYSCNVSPLLTARSDLAIYAIADTGDVPDSGKVSRDSWYVCGLSKTSKTTAPGPGRVRALLQAGARDGAPCQGGPDSPNGLT